MRARYLYRVTPVTRLEIMSSTIELVDTSRKPLDCVSWAHLQHLCAEKADTRAFVVVELL